MQQWQTVSQARRKGYRPSQPNTRTKAAREDVDSGALDMGPFGRDGDSRTGPEDRLGGGEKKTRAFIEHSSSTHREMVHSPLISFPRPIHLHLHRDLLLQN